MTTASEVEGFADTALQYPMIFTKLLTVAAVESAVAFCVNRDVKIQQHDSNENVALKSEFCLLSVSIAMIPSYLLCQMYANPSEFEFQGTMFTFTKRN